MTDRNTAALLLLAAMLLAPALAGRDAHAQKHDDHKSQQARPARKALARYVCPMHSDVVSASPGSCPECGMFLKAAGEKTANAESAPDKAPAPLAPAAAKTASAPGVGPVATPTGEKPPASGGGATPSEGSANYFPNHVLVTQDNKPVRFYDDLVKGKVVLINFMFTTCTGVCPPMASNMAKVQSYLGDRVGKDVVMISISVDPTVDTPDKLKKYAANFKARTGWYFLTGEKQNVDWVLYKLGGYVEDKMQHSGVLIIGNDATGEWMKTAALRNPAQIAEAVIALLKDNNNNTPPSAPNP